MKYRIKKLFLRHFLTSRNLTDMINVYFKNRALTICKKDDALLKEQGIVILRPSDKNELADIPEMFVSNPTAYHWAIVVEEPNTEEDIFNDIFSNVRPINAGGGIIHSDGKYLMIYRNGMWDMSKGKQEPGENIRDTAHREIREETGLECTPKELVGITHHLYRINRELVIKHTHWFKMEAEGCPKTTPQTEEGIEKCVWLTTAEVKEYLNKAFPSIREIFTRIVP